jgi:ubiquinone/menaquinone biosynthesis C-methylase UbiE
VSVQCHQGDLADLGFATSGSVDLVIASHTLGNVDDLPRVLRQVHRVLKPGAPFVVAITHPVAAMFGPEHELRYAYGAASITFSSLYMAFDRSNFRFDMVHELDLRRTRDPIAPSVLVVRARKQGV